jgi:putative transposase
MLAGGAFDFAITIVQCPASPRCVSTTKYCEIVPWNLKRYQQTRDLQFITFSCYHRQPLLAQPEARRTFEESLESVRNWYGFYVTGYVVMPEHVHLLISEPERKNLAIVIQMLKQAVVRRLRHSSPDGALWQRRYYDFNVFSEPKSIEKLRYMHRNPVERGLAARPDDWLWSSYRHYASGEEGPVEIESHWTARKRERLGVTPKVVLNPRTELPHPPPKNGAEG